MSCERICFVFDETPEWDEVNAEYLKLVKEVTDVSNFRKSPVLKYKIVVITTTELSAKIGSQIVSDGEHIECGDPKDFLRCVIERLYPSYLEDDLELSEIARKITTSKGQRSHSHR